VIASQSANFIERFVVLEGHTVDRSENDYGYDLFLFTYDANGYVEPGWVYIQLKATDNIKGSADGNAWDHEMEIAHYNLWTSEPFPVFLVLYDAQRKRAYWLYVQRYFKEDVSRRPRDGAKSVTVHIPKNQRFTRRTVRYMRNRKQDILSQMEQVVEHAN
jgi:hypothetical protein